MRALVWERSENDVWKLNGKFAWIDGGGARRLERNTKIQLNCEALQFNRIRIFIGFKSWIESIWVDEEIRHRTNTILIAHASGSAFVCNEKEFKNKHRRNLFLIEKAKWNMTYRRFNDIVERRRRRRLPKTL